MILCLETLSRIDFQYFSVSLKFKVFGAFNLYEGAKQIYSKIYLGVDYALNKFS